MMYFFFLFLFPVNIQAQNIPEVQGDWHGTIQISGQSLPIETTFSYDDGELDGTIDIPMQQAFDLPVEVLKTTADSLIFQFQTGTGPAVFYGKRISGEESIEGNFQQSGMTFSFSLNRQKHNNHTASNGEEVIIETRSGQTAGNLLLTESPSPLVILLNGSGSQDRDETVAGFKIFGQLASLLFEEGYSSFRFDDRGIGKSTGAADATLEELAEDLADITTSLEKNYGDRFSDIILLGHSQGGLVALLAAGTVNPEGIIFMGSPLISGDQVVNQQIKKISELQGISQAVTDQNLVFQNEIYEVIRSGSGWESVEKNLAGRLREQINQLPEQKREALRTMDSFIQGQINRQLSSAKSRWFKSFIEFDPAEKVKDLEIPLLAVFGEKDVQVLAETNTATAEKIKSENSSLLLETVTIREANHLFQKADSGMPGEYGMLEKEFADGFQEEILFFLKRFGRD
ncbi:MAG: alpha/beta hydrolase [Balneolaceae bacterium]